MKTCTPEYVITLISDDGKEGVEPLEKNRHPHEVLLFLTGHKKIDPTTVHVHEYDWTTGNLLEKLTGQEWLEEYCVLEPARWRFR